MKFSIQTILGGDFLKKSKIKQQYKLILLIAVLIFLYIYRDYLGQAQQHELTTLRKELQDTHFTKTTINAQLLTSTRQSAIYQALQERGSKVKETKVAPIRIE